LPFNANFLPFNANVANEIKDKSFNNTFPVCNTPEELYTYYQTKPINPDCHSYIVKDLKRTDPGNVDWKVDPTTGDNHLYNVLKAFCNYDPEIGYA
jgi:hypothetical protein